MRHRLRSVRAPPLGSELVPLVTRKDTLALADLSADLTEGFDTASTVPLYAGIEFKL